MIRTRTISANEASLIAVSALDDLVVDLVCAKRLLLSPAFLDWIADEATPMIEEQIGECFNDPRFAATLRMGDPRIMLARWVQHWVCPEIARRFEQLADDLPFEDSSPAALLPIEPAPRRAQAVTAAPAGPAGPRRTPMVAARPAWLRGAAQAA